MSFMKCMTRKTRKYSSCNKFSPLTTHLLKLIGIIPRKIRSHKHPEILKIHSRPAQYSENHAQHQTSPRTTNPSLRHQPIPRKTNTVITIHSPNPSLPQRHSPHLATTVISRCRARTERARRRHRHRRIDRASATL